MHPLVSAEELARHLDDPRWIIFDCRHDLMKPADGEALYRTSHIRGARFAHLDRDLSGTKTGGNGRHPLPPHEDFTAFLAAAGVDEDSVIVAYDASNGLYASRLWWLTRAIGHADVAVLDGGLPAWQQAGLTMTDAMPATSKGNIVLREPLTSQVDTDDVEANLATQAKLVVDARAPERYRGEVEPLDPVAGHIPHAVNHPMARNLASDGRFKEASALRSAFDETMAGREPEAIVQSCGSGVTGCHNLLAMEVAGLPGAALYAGSWSAWCADPARPIERGPSGD
jgi:thiosulfate/3-mercaptopyruvate sulfurtransferase